MVHVLLLVLKIIGFIILGLIGLVLALVLIVLLVPLRYHVQIEHGNELKANGTGSWLLHIVHARVTYLDNQLKIWVKVFGFTLYDKDNPRKARKSEKEKGFLGKSKGTKVIRKKDSKKKDLIRPNEPIQKEVVKKVDSKKETTVKDSIKNDSTERVQRLEPVSMEPKFDHTVEEEKLNDAKGKRKKNSSDGRLGFLQRIKKIFDWTKNIKVKTENIWDKIRERIKKLYQATININRIKQLILDFYHDTNNREGIKITLLSAKKLLKHILPTKVKSRVIFGTGDPCSTGQALSAMGIVYSMYGDKIRIIPDFNEKRFEGQHDFKGRIRILTLAIVILKLLLDKRWKELRRNLKTLKEAL